MRHAVRSRLALLVVAFGLGACAGTRPHAPASTSLAPQNETHAITFSNPAAVQLPHFPPHTCPVAAGADSAAINAAITSCSAAGGGTITFTPGTYAVGSIHLQSNIRLDLTGVTLRSSGAIDEPEPYTSPVACQDEGHRHWHNALIWGENLTNVAIVGAGTLDGAGLAHNGQKMIAFKSSRLLQFEGFQQIHTGHFAYLLTDCHDVTLARLTIHPSRDGVDLMECTNVNAHDLEITGGGDDAFAIKSDCAMGRPLITDNITIANSVLGSGCTAMQIGSETWGNFQNISWINDKIVHGGKAGIGLQMNDGAVIKNVSYDGITMTNTSFPIFVNVTSLLRAPSKIPGHAENIRIRNVTATSLVAGNNRSVENTAVIISGEPQSPHQGIVLENVDITFPGGGAPHGEPPEGEKLTAKSEYNPRFITPVPAYGAYIRHARGVEFHNVRLGLGADDQRPAVVAHDVDGLVFDRLDAQRPSLQLSAITHLTIQHSTALENVAGGSVKATTN
jgi:hypothetical protein